VSDVKASDLVEYFVVGVPDLNSLRSIIPVIGALAETGMLRLLDWTIVERDADGEVHVTDVGEISPHMSVDEISREAEGLLTDHDVTLAASALPPGTVGFILVTEDRWAEPLAAAMRRVGGRIIAGERIPASRLETALDRRHRQDGDHDAR